MYTEDGFELRAHGDTIEVYASGELFHDPSPPIFRAFRMFAERTAARRVLCDLRLATYILEPNEMIERAGMTAKVLAGYPAAFVVMSDQRELTGLMIENLRRAGTEAEQFNSKQAARDWLAGLRIAA